MTFVERSLNSHPMERTKQRDKGLAKAIAAAGSITELANRIKVTVSAVSQWETTPVLRCAAVERVTGIPKSVLRPDVFGANAQKNEGRSIA